MLQHNLYGLAQGKSTPDKCPICEASRLVKTASLRSSKNDIILDRVKYLPKSHMSKMS